MGKCIFGHIFHTGHNPDFDNFDTLVKNSTSDIIIVTLFIIRACSVLCKFENASVVKQKLL